MVKGFEGNWLIYCEIIADFLGEKI
jgi:hypothetical protein